MKLQQWLLEHGRSQAWLAKRLGVTESAVSQRLGEQRRTGRPLPTTWIAVVLSITEGAVTLADEWPARDPGRGDEDEGANYRTAV